MGMHISDGQNSFAWKMPFISFRKERLVTLKKYHKWNLFCHVYMWSPLLSVPNFSNRNGWAWWWFSSTKEDFLLRRVFVIILTFMIVLIKIHLAMMMSGLSFLSCLFILKCIPLKGCCSVCDRSRMLCVRALAGVIMTVAIGGSKRNSKPTCERAKGLWRYESLCVSPFANDYKCQKLLTKHLLEKWPWRIVVFTITTYIFHRKKWKLFGKKYG